MDDSRIGLHDPRENKPVTTVGLKPFYFKMNGLTNERLQKIDGHGNRKQILIWTIVSVKIVSELKKKPYVGEPNKGKVKNYDGIFEKVDNPDGEFNHRANAIAQGFQRYVRSYYYSAQVRFPI